MTISPHHVAGTLLIGGLTIGGYFGINSLIPSSLSSHLNSLGLEILSDNWGEKETSYKKATVEDLIASIAKENNSENIIDFANKLEKWCNKYKEKYFLGEDDLNYKRFSLWCTKTQNIQTVLEKRGLKSLSEDEKTKKFEAYKSAQNSDKFISRPSAPKTEITKENLNNWCREKIAINYKYESEPDLKRIIKWCYKS